MCAVHLKIYGYFWNILHIANERERGPRRGMGEGESKKQFSEQKSKNLINWSRHYFWKIIQGKIREEYRGIAGQRVCERERERERGRGGERHRETEREREKERDRERKTGK